MAEKRFICDINLDGNALKNALLHPSPNPPADPKEGQIWFNSEDGTLYYHNGNGWVTFVKGEELQAVAKDLESVKTTLTRVFGQRYWSSISGSLSMAVVSGTLRLSLGGQQVCSVPIGDIIPNALIKNADLMTVPEPGVKVEVPYIRLIFDSTAGSQVVRFSVKELIDVYDGANLKLSDAYSPTDGTVLPGDSMDVAIGKLSRAVEKGGEGVLVAVYRMTSYRDVTEAFSNGIAVFCLDGEHMFSLTKDDGVDKVLFARQEGGKTEYAQVDIHDEWTRWEESASVPDNVVYFEDAFVLGRKMYLPGRVEDETFYPERARVIGPEDEQTLVIE